MARRLLAWPGGLTVHDVEPAPVDELVAAGAQRATDVADLASRSDVLCVMVRDDEQVWAVVEEALPAASPGLVIAVHSTVAPETPRRLAEAAAAYGVSVVDAPVSGGAQGASEGRLAVMVGGADEDVARCREPFGLLGDLVLHAGPVGAGTRLKLARNLVHFVAFTATTEAQRLASASGLDLRALGEVVRHTDAVTGGPGAIMHRDTVAPIEPDDFWYAVMDHVRALGEKDLDAAIGLAASLDVDVPLARLAREHLGPGLGITDHRGGDLP
jgi:3-hydroxyisobutyrate dehydrogenase-like beta-hydroxyacid dehydrogenase